MGFSRPSCELSGRIVAPPLTPIDTELVAMYVGRWRRYARGGQPAAGQVMAASLLTVCG